MTKDHRSKDFADEVIRRRGQISVFDLWRQRRGRGPAPEKPGGHYWWIAATVSLLAGFAAEWSDIAGGARLDVIATKWMVISGVIFFVLIKFRTMAKWFRRRRQKPQSEK